MPAFLIVDAEVTDPVAYERYKALAAPAVARYGGRYLARGGAAETLEGEWSPRRIVVLEFSDAAAAKAFYDGPEYREARAARAGAAEFRMIVVEGV